MQLRCNFDLLAVALTLTQQARFCAFATAHQTTWKHRTLTCRHCNDYGWHVKYSLPSTGARFFGSPSTFDRQIDHVTLIYSHVLITKIQYIEFNKFAQLHDAACSVTFESRIRHSLSFLFLFILSIFWCCNKRNASALQKIRPYGKLRLHTG